MENATAKIIWIEIHESQYKNLTYWLLEVILSRFLRGPQKNLNLFDAFFSWSVKVNEAELTEVKPLFKNLT